MMMRSAQMMMIAVMRMQPACGTCIICHCTPAAAQLQLILLAVFKEFIIRNINIIIEGAKPDHYTDGWLRRRSILQINL